MTAANREVAMNELELCPGCGVPLIVSRNLYWDTNGVIVVKASPRSRFVFFESDTIDEMLKGIEDMIGLPIEHIVLESRSREARRYIERSFPPALCEPIRDYVSRKTAGENIPPETERGLMEMFKGVTQSIIDIGRAYGYGDQRLEDAWERGEAFPWRTQVIRNPHSKLNFIGDQLGSIEAIEGLDMKVEYTEMESGAYRVSMWPGGHPVGLAERLKRKRYDFKPGEILYDRCSECEIPLEVASRDWDIQKGAITDPATGWRMAVFGPSPMDAIFDDLEAELGEAIPEMVIEAQRRHIKSAWSSEAWNRPEKTFQHMFAVRGLGNLVDFEGDSDHLSVRIENSCYHLPVIGTIQALVELTYRVDGSDLAWELSEDGDLSVNVAMLR
jgi:hypothetical protein